MWSAWCQQQKLNIPNNYTLVTLAPNHTDEDAGKAQTEPHSAQQWLQPHIEVDDAVIYLLSGQEAL